MNFIKFTLGQIGLAEEEKSEHVFNAICTKKWTAENIWVNWSSQDGKGEIKFSLTGISCFMHIQFKDYLEWQNFIMCMPTGYNFTDQQTLEFYNELVLLCNS